jgi:hypothetical protein
MNFGDNSWVRAVDPKIRTLNHSDRTIFKEGHANVTGGYPLAYLLVSVSIGARREEIKTETFATRIQGSGVNTNVDEWTLKENGSQRSGLPPEFIAGVMVQSTETKETTVKVYVKAEIARGRLRKSVRSELNAAWVLKGTQTVGSRPAGLEIDETLFSKSRTNESGAVEDEGRET